MVYVDPLFPTTRSAKWPYGEACHMAADTVEELHVTAEKLGLKRAWFQSHHVNPVMHHYDLTPNKRKHAIRLGAKEITRQEWAERVNASLPALKEAQH